MSQLWDNQPNRQKALETSIPTLCGIMLALVGGLFVAAAITDVTFLKGETEVSPLIIFKNWDFYFSGERRLIVLVLCALTGICFYKSLMHCVWSQLSYFDTTAPNPDVKPVLSTASAEHMEHWVAIQKHWNSERQRHAAGALVYFDIGINLLPLPLIFLLPPGLLALGFYVWTSSLIFFYKNWARR